MFIVHPHGLSVWAAHAVADDVPADDNVGVERRGPAHDDARGQRSDVERAWLVRNLRFWDSNTKKRINIPRKFYNSRGLSLKRSNMNQKFNFNENNRHAHTHNTTRCLGYMQSLHATSFLSYVPPFQEPIFENLLELSTFSINVQERFGATHIG